MITATGRAAHLGRRRVLPFWLASLGATTTLLLSACGTGVTSDTSDSASSSDTVTITNCGRDLSFDSAPTRLVGLAPTQTELLIRLGLRDLLIGQAQTETSPLSEDIATEAEDIPVLSTDTPPAREDLLAAEPDLVVAPTEYEFTSAQGFASIDQLNQSGVEAYVATGGCADRRNTARVTDLLTDIDDLGEILGVPDRAAQLTKDVQRRLDAVAATIEGKAHPTVAQVYIEGNAITVVGAGVEADIIKTAGGDNVFDPDAPEFAEFFAATITPEEIIDRDPDAIVFGTSGPDHEQQTRDYLLSTFPDVAAVKNDNLIAVPASDLFPGTLGNIEAVELIAQNLYPAAF